MPPFSRQGLASTKLTPLPWPPRPSDSSPPASATCLTLSRSIVSNINESPAPYIDIVTIFATLCSLAAWIVFHRQGEVMAAQGLALFREWPTALIMTVGLSPERRRQY